MRIIGVKPLGCIKNCWYIAKSSRVIKEKKIDFCNLYEFSILIFLMFLYSHTHFAFPLVSCNIV